MNQDFKNKVVLVTASSKGIGFAAAKSFYQRGALVAICSRSIENLQNAAGSIENVDFNRLKLFQCDLASRESCENLIPNVERSFDSSIDIFVHNTGGPKPSLLVDLSVCDWVEAINANLMSAAILSRLIIKKMMQKKFGRIIFLTTTLAKEPQEGMGLSNVTRAAIASLSKTFSKEIPSKANITINTILTGGCLTDRFYSLVEKKALDSNSSSETVIDELSKSVPVGFFCEPEEFSKVILFLASTDARYLNGLSLPVDGGALKSLF